MSTLKTTNIQNASSATTNIALDTSGGVTVGAGITASNGTVVMSSPYTMRNKIINGAMQIDQRNSGASVTPANLAYTLDRWGCLLTQSSKYTVQQNAGAVTPPIGFSNYLGVTSSSAYAVAAGDRFNIYQVIEGFNGANLAWGTANAKTVTLSFQVYSSLTGTFSGSMRTGGGGYSYVFTYSIPVANTWTSISVTIPGPTVGTWATDNTAFAYVSFSLGVGSTYSTAAGSWTLGNFWGLSTAVNVVGTNGATWYVTGVQFEIGTVATPFEYRNYQQELAMCQRYYYRMTGTASGSDEFGIGMVYSSTQVVTPVFFPTIMRTVPTSLEQSGTAANYGLIVNAGTATCSSVPVFNTGSVWGASVIFIGTGLTVGQAAIPRALSASGYLGWSAEL